MFKLIKKIYNVLTYNKSQKKEELPCKEEDQIKNLTLELKSMAYTTKNNSYKENNRNASL